MSTEIKITNEERTFCQLYVNGRAPYAGNAIKCYVEVFRSAKNDPLAGQYAKELLKKEHISEYLKELEEISAEEAGDMKRFLTANLKHIVEEASHAEYRDRRGTVLSPAAMRSVAVSASKALMDMYPIKENQVNKIDISSEGSGITFNVIVPETTSNPE